MYRRLDARVVGDESTAAADAIHCMLGITRRCSLTEIAILRGLGHMSRHAVLTTVATVVLNLAVIGAPVQAQDEPTLAASSLADIHAIAEAAEQGDAEAQRALGLMYDNGRGVPQDYVEAIVWYRRAAEQGDAGAQLFLGNMYREAVVVGMSH